MSDCKNNCPDCKCNGEVQNPQRRKFMGVVVGLINGVIGIAIVGPVIGFIGAPLFRRIKGRWIPVMPESDIAVGQTTEATFNVTVKDGYRTVDQKYSLYLRRTENAVVAFDPSCTHLGCRVTFQDNKERYFCPCHGGVFDIDGSVVSGPPPRPLKQYETKIEDGQVWVYREV
jgi:menaquinol-cytochrome c reductase iron-sulfur subunit